MLIILENGRRSPPRLPRFTGPRIRGLTADILAEMPSIRELFAERATRDMVAELDAEIMRNLRAVRATNADNT